MPTSYRRLLLTGAPGVGKTTVIRRVAERLSGMPMAGFYTEEIRVAGVRQGFRLVGFDGRERLIAHVDLSKRHRVGKYGVNLAAIEAASDELLGLEPEPMVYLVDEIGKMECCAKRFVAAMRHLLASDATVVATVGKSGAGFIAEIKRRRDCLLWEIERENRDGMPGRVLRWLEAPR